MSYIACKLYIDSLYYQKLNSEGQALFDYEEASSLYYTVFPAASCHGDCLYEYIIAFVEVGLIMTNNNYDLTHASTLKCEVFKLSKSKTIFTLLIEITNLNNPTCYHDFMTFEILNQTAHCFDFKLLGDQTLFSPEAHSSNHSIYL